MRPSHALLALHLSISLAFLGFAAAPAAAQYLFLDSNGDGVHGASDVVGPGGTTHVDLWLVTNADRDGSPATCASGPEPLDFVGYEIILHATNGTVVWSGVENRIPLFTTDLGALSDGRDLAFGFTGASSLDAGAYRIASLDLSVATGTPTITIVPSTPLDASRTTAFHSASCVGTDLDNSLKLGIDWTDVDGLGFGGAPNLPPSLAPIADMMVLEGTTAEQTVTATDPEGAAIEFTKVDGPGYMTVETTDPGAGAGTGRILLAPPVGHTEIRTASVGASDGLASGTRSFTITVPIAFTPIADVVVPAYGLTTRNVTVTDPSGPALTIEERSGPPFSRLRTTGPRSAEIVIEPGVNDAGVYGVTVRVTDGVTTAEAAFGITVTELPACSPGLCVATRSFLAGDAPLDIVTADLNHDGNADLATADQLSNTVGVLIGRGDGTFEPLRLFDVEGPLPRSLAVGDVDGDGNPDIAVAQPGAPGPGLEGHDVTILFGDGLGGFPRRVDVPVADFPATVALADFDEDGHVDLLVGVDYTNPRSLSGHSLYRGRGDGTFGSEEVVPNTRNSSQLAILDANGDGHLDFAYATWATSRGLDIVLGRGDGTFDAAERPPGSPIPPYDSPGYGFSVAVADMNGDRLDDAVVGAERLLDPYNASAGILYGSSAGVFTASPPIVLDPAPPNPSTTPVVAVADFSGDGRPDIAGLMPPSGRIVVAMARPDGAFSPARLLTAGITFPRAMVAADFDHDGRPDLAVCEYGNIFARVYLNRGYVVIPAAVTMSPPRLGAPGRGGSVRASLELPAAYDISDVDVTTIRLDDTVAPSSKSIALGDQDRDGIPDLTFSFERASLPRLPVGEHEFRITATLANGDPVAGSATVRIVGPGGHGTMALRVVSPLGVTPIALAAESEPAVRHTLEVFDVHGRLVRSWTERAGADGVRTSWDGRDRDGGTCGSGVYFVRAKAGMAEGVTRAVLIR